MPAQKDTGRRDWNGGRVAREVENGFGGSGERFRDHGPQVRLSGDGERGGEVGDAQADAALSFAPRQLALTKHGYVAHPVNQVLQEYDAMRELRVRFEELTGVQAPAKVQMVLPVGRSEAPFRSYRRHSATCWEGKSRPLRFSGHEREPPRHSEFMRWSSFVKVGLSGTSLALAVGCSQPEGSERTAKVEAVTDRALDEVSATVRREQDRRDREARREAERQSTASTVENPWFLRPAGDTRLSSAQNPPTTPETGTTLRSNTQPPVGRPTVVAPARPNPPVTQPAQARPRDKGHWRAACGRG